MIVSGRPSKEGVKTVMGCLIESGPIEQAREGKGPGQCSKWLVSTHTPKQFRVQIQARAHTWDACSNHSSGQDLCGRDNQSM